ncbi:hypothetical protein [Oribacterium sinus]|uniref:hypothetical protein n=1 Tax=Oribacterium sinus TaxID=237576 RepID=UPI0028E35DB0|nr:hypothetical protein [Oribacterium sinus]
MKKLTKGVILSLAFVLPTILVQGKAFAAEAGNSGEWKAVNGKWFYEKEGKPVKDWLLDKGNWYYLSQDSGEMLLGSQEIKGVNYYFQNKNEAVEGAMARGWYQDSKGAYRFYDNREGSPTEGQELRGWQWIDGYCYYFEEEGEKKGILLQNGVSKDGYTVNEEGQWTVNGVVQFVEGKGFITKKSDVKGVSRTIDNTEARPERTSSTRSHSGRRSSGVGSNESGSINRNGSNAGASGNTGASSSGVGEQDKKNSKTELPQENSKAENSKVETGKENPDKKAESLLADGVFYGTGTWSRYYEQSGPDIVKVSIKDGKIAEVSNVKYTEDDSYQDKTFKIFDYLKGLEDVKELEKNLKEKKGEAYDAVASATQSTLGEVSAVDNALARSRKLKKDGKEQKIAYFDFSRKPNARAVGDSLDLSDTILDLHFADGSRQDVPYTDFDKYGITVDRKQGSPLPELGTTFPVYFQNDESLIKLPSFIQVQKDYSWAYADEIRLTYEDGEVKTLPTDKEHFVYRAVETGKDITKAELLRVGKVLTEGVYDANRSVWDFHLDDKQLPKNYDAWRYKDIQLKEVMDEGKIPASVELLYNGEYILEDTIHLEKEAILSGEVLEKDGDVNIDYFDEIEKNPSLLLGEAENENEKPVKVELSYIPDKTEKKVTGEGNSENGDGEEEKNATVELSFPDLIIKGKTAKVILHLHYISIEEEGEDGAVETE